MPFNKKCYKNIDNYTDEYKWKSNDQQNPDVCQYCAHCGETDLYSYVCAKEPYKLVVVSWCGHCDGFAKTPRKISMLENFILKMNWFKFKKAGIVKSK